VPASAARPLRLVTLREGGQLPDAILDWVSSGRPAKDVFDLVREAVPGLDTVATDELLDRVDELSSTVASLTGLNLMAEVMDALAEQEKDGVAPEDAESPDLDSMYGGEEPSELDVIASANLQTAYSRGRQDEDEDTGDWWEYVTQLGACEICAPLDGTQAPQDDGIWTDRIPPLHPNCVYALKAIPAQKIQATPDDVPAESKGARGWGNPQKRYDPDLSDKPAALLPYYHEKLRNLRRNE
jgi:hypothetical protein